MNAVICKKVKKYFGEGVGRVEALRGVDLEIPKEKLSLLMGPSGSGKTTLISIIAGILTEDAGECLVFDQKINQLKNHERTSFRSKNIGFVFQMFNLIPMLTNEENISIPLILNGIERKEALRKSQMIMKDLGLQDKAGLYPKDLSGGQQQRIAIGRGLVHDPPLLVCDEPTSFLDHQTGKMIMQLLRTMIEKKKVTVIVVSHDPRVMEFADHIHHLEDGVIID